MNKCLMIRKCWKKYTHTPETIGFTFNVYSEQEKLARNKKVHTREKAQFKFSCLLAHSSTYFEYLLIHLTILDNCDDDDDGLKELKTTTN